MRRLCALIFACALLAAGALRAETFEAKHDHFLGSCSGRLVFGNETVDYVTDKRGHSRSWKYEDIQQLEIAPSRITILTYHSRAIRFGTDQAFNFKLVPGTLTDRFRTDVSRKLTHPIVSAVIPEESDARFSIPARHKRIPGGSSQGILEFGEMQIVFRAEEPGNSRVWRYEELLSTGSTGPYRFRIGALEKTGGEYGEEKNYVFDLKRRMTSEEYDFVWRKIYGR